MTNEMKQNILEHESVDGSSEWKQGNMDRTYINIKGAKKNMAGDRSTKIWIDNVSGELCWKLGKGISSAEFNANLDALKESFEMVRKF